VIGTLAGERTELKVKTEDRRFIEAQSRNERYRVKFFAFQ